MPSRVSQYAARLIETGWLAAVVVTPLYFDVWSNRVFEPDKLTLLRSLALGMVAAGLVYRLERGRPEPGALRQWLGRPLVIPLLVLTAVIGLATLLSTTPWLSLTGSYNRLQGLYTWLAYVVVFLSIITLLADRDQLDRLVTALILPSLPVALYGVMQRFNRDPMPWIGDVTARVASTMGNSIFVAAYLILVLPLTAARLIEALRELDDEESGSRGYASILRVTVYLVFLAFQVGTIVLTQSRGPWLGMFGSLFFLGLLASALYAGRKAMLGWLGLWAAAGLFLVIFNLPGSPLAPLRETPYIGRLGRVFDTEGGTGKVRVLIWDGAIDLITSDPYRMAVGWGPESMHWVYNPFYPPELGNYESRNASPDRSHNETLDALVTTGVVGLVAYLWLFTSVFYYGLRWLGLVEGAGGRNQFLGLWLGGGLLAVLGFRLWSGGGTFFGVALPAGMIAGLFAFVAWRVLRGWQAPERPGRLLMIGLLSALIAHFIEIHFGIAIAATRVLFFAMAAALVVVGGLAAERPALFEDRAPERAGGQPAAPAPRRRRSSRAASPAPARAPAGSIWPWVAQAGLMSVVLVTLVYDFVVVAQVGDAPGQWSSGDFRAVLWLFGFTWLIGSFLLGSETILASHRLHGRLGSGIGRDLMVYGGLSLGIPFAYGLNHRWLLGQGGGADTSASLLLLYYLVLAFLLLLWAWVLMRRDPAPEPIVRSRAVWLYPVLAVLAVLLVFFSNLNEVRADIYYKEGWNGYHQAARYDEAVIDYDRALALDPREDYYLLFKGKALLERADDAARQFEERHAAAIQADPAFSEYVESVRGDASARDRQFEEAIQVLDRALERAPRNTDHTANLARAYQIWGDRTFDPERRAERLARSREYFLRAIAPDLSPNNAGLREELAMTEFMDGRTDEAMRRLDEAMAIDPAFRSPYKVRARIHRENEDWQSAADDYRHYLEGREGRDDIAAWSELGMVLGRLNDIAGAIEANERVLALSRRRGQADLPTLGNLAGLLRQEGRVEEACAHVREGLSIDPEDPTMVQLDNALGCGAAASGAAPGDAGGPSVVSPVATPEAPAP